MVETAHGSFSRPVAAPSEGACAAHRDKAADRVASGVWPGSEALLPAYAQKKLPTDRCKMIELPWSSAVMRVLDNGRGGCGGNTRRHHAYARKRAVTAGADAMMARTEIMAAKGLKGKRVGVNVCGLGAYLLVNAMESAGMTINDIQMVQLIQREMKRCSRIKARSAVVPVSMNSGRLLVGQQGRGQKTDRNLVAAQ